MLIAVEGLERRYVQGEQGSEGRKNSKNASNQVTGAQIQFDLHATDHNVCGSIDLDPMCTGAEFAMWLPYVDNVPSNETVHLRGTPRFQSNTTKCFRSERHIDSNLKDDAAGAAYSGIQQLAR